MADRFEDFRAKVNYYQQHPDNPLGPAGDLPIGGNNNCSGNAPQTPEELQAMMEQEAADQAHKEIEAIRDGVFTPPDQRKDPFEGMMPVDSAITEVTVFSNHAKVVRTAEINIVKGSQILVFKNMPQLLISESVRAEGSSHDAVVKIGAIQSKTLNVPVNVAEPDRVSFKEIDQLEAEARKLTAERQSYEMQKDFFEKVSSRAVKDEDKGNEAGKNAAPLEIAPEKWLQASRAYREGMTEILGIIAASDARINEIARETARKENALRRAYHGQNRMNVVMIPVEADATGKLNLRLSYQVNNANWRPSYDARMSSEKGTVEIVQYASVTQGTGEDWKDVALTLSTAQPQKDMTEPAIRPFWVDVAEPPPPQGASQTLTLPATPNAPSGDPLAEWRAKTEAKRVKMEQEQQPEGREAEQPEVVPMVTPIHPQPRFGEARPVQIDTAEINSGGIVSQYKIPGQTTVMADGSATKVLIGNFNAESKLQVHIYPKYSTTAQLMIHTKLVGDNPILPGRVNMFRDGAFSGQTNFPLLLPDAEHDISLGADEQVTIKRRTLRDEKQQQGLISKDNLIAREYVTEILNMHETPVEVIVKETTPAPKDEKITVDLRSDFTTQGYKKDDDNVTGLLSWDFTMKPKEKKSLNLGWTVNWPKNYLIMGM